MVQSIKIKNKLSSCTKWTSKLKVYFDWHCWSKFFLISAFICRQSSFLFQHREKSSSKRVLMTDLGTIQNWPNLSKHQYNLTSTKFLIWKIDENVSSFQSLNMLSFHIRLLHLKLIYYDLISIFVTFGTMYILFLSSHVFISLKFNNIHISVLFWNIVKPQWN